MADKLTPTALKRARSRAEKHFAAYPTARAYEESFEYRQVLRIQRSRHEGVYSQIRRGKRQLIGDPRVLTAERIAYLARKSLNEAHEYGDALRPDAQNAKLGKFIDVVHAPWLRGKQKRAEKTLVDLKRCFGHLYSKRLTEITQTVIDGYVETRSAAGVLPETIVRDLNPLRKVMREAKRRKYLRTNPFDGWEKPELADNGVTRYLSAAEEKALRTALQERDDKARRERESANKWRAERGYELLLAIPEDGYSDHLTPMVLVSANTGMRYGELTSLEWSAVDLNARNLTVTGRTSKGAKTRHIPLNAEVVDVLRCWRAQGAGKGLVFANPDGSRIASTKTAWLRVLKDAGITGFRWHDLRHTFASNLVQKGVDLAVVRVLLGHGDFELTLRYAHLREGQTAEAVARLAA